MDLLSFGFSIASLVAVVVGGFLVRSYLPSYLSEKAKNLASKEDLAQITDLVERVKAQHVSEIERLKSDLISEGQVVERRRRVYEDVCTALRVFISGHDQSAEAKSGFYEAYAAAWLWASDDLLILLNQFIELQVRFSASPDSVQQSELKRAYADVVVAMRRDVGFPVTAVAAESYQFVHF